MQNSNSISLDTPVQCIKRLLLSSTFNTKQTNALYREILPYISQLSASEYSEIIDLAKNRYKLRTAPLLLAIVALKENKLENPKETLKGLLTNAKLLTTSLDIYQNINGHVKPLAAPLKKALSEKLTELNTYDLIKGNVPVNSFKLSDVIKLTHPKPVDEAYSTLFNQILNNGTPSLDNWETVISGCKTNIERQMQWERLLLDKKINNLSLIRNLNNLINSGVNTAIIKQAILDINLTKVNLYQLLNATINLNNHQLLTYIQELINTKTNLVLKDKSLVLIDVSGSMSSGANSSTTRLQVATMLAYFIGRVSEDSSIVFTAGNDSRNTVNNQLYIKDIKNVSYLDFVADVQYAYERLGYGGIFTRQALEWCKENVQDTFERTIVISDSVDCDHYNATSVPFTKYSYLLDISRSSGNIIYNTNWTAEIRGWSDELPNFIKEYETDY